MRLDTTWLLIRHKVFAPKCPSIAINVEISDFFVLKCVFIEKRRMWQRTLGERCDFL
jgi:hypothetical protein